MPSVENADMYGVPYQLEDTPEDEARARLAAMARIQAELDMLEERLRWLEE